MRPASSSKKGLKKTANSSLESSIIDKFLYSIEASLKSNTLNSKRSQKENMSLVYEILEKEPAART